MHVDVGFTSGFSTLIDGAKLFINDFVAEQERGLVTMREIQASFLRIQEAGNRPIARDTRENMEESRRTR